MKILRLGNSDDVNPALAEDERTPAVAERIFAEAAGERPEREFRVIWPAPVLPGLVERWMERSRPDMVVLVVSSFWFTYPVVALRLGQLLGPLGGPLAKAGLWAGAKRPVGESRAFRLLREVGLRTAGGAPYFTGDEIVARMEACIRAVVAHETAVLVVRGPLTPFGQGSAKARWRAEERRLAVHRALGELCGRLHVEYCGRDAAAYYTTDTRYYGADAIHATRAEHQARGELEAAAMIAAWRRR